MRVKAGRTPHVEATVGRRRKRPAGGGAGQGESEDFGVAGSVLRCSRRACRRREAACGAGWRRARCTGQTESEEEGRGQAPLML